MSNELFDDPYYLEIINNDTHYGIATAKGNQTMAKIIVNKLADTTDPNFAVAFDVYNDTHAWPHYVPGELIKIAITGFGKGIMNIFDLVFKENDTKISRDTLIRCMWRTQDFSEKDSRLSWMDAVTEMGEMEKDFDEFINPWDVLKNIDMTIYRKNYNEV